LPPNTTSTPRASSTPRVFLWRASEHRGDRWRMPGEPGELHLADAPATETMALSRRDAVVLLDTRTLQPRAQFAVAAPLADIILAADASVVVGRSGPELSAWNARTGALLHSQRLVPDDGPCNLGPVLPDPLRVRLLCNNGQAFVLDLGDGTRVAITTAINTRGVLDARGVEVVFGGNPGSLIAWAPATGQQHLLRDYHGIINALVAVPGQRQVVVSSDRVADVWDLDQRRSWPLPGHSLNINAVTVSDDGQRIATVSRDNIIRVFARETGDLLQTLASRVLLGNVIDLSPDGSRLISVTHDHRLMLWDLAASPEALLEPRELAGHRSQVCVLRFAPDGDSLLSVDDDGRAIRWADDLPHDQEGVRRWVATHHDENTTVPISRTGCTPAPGDLSAKTDPPVP
jgi:WD40 repeat protein